ncbi:MAG: allantoicase [Aquabacterium sp.]|nr:allantoicase [Ferruginibacter sp.]
MPDNNFTTLTNLAAERLGAKTLLCSDDFFAEKENLLKPGRGIFIADKYTDRGKWMDGWESRRKRGPGHDWCIIQLATPGKIYGVDIDTNYFLGNHPPFASVEAFNIKDADTDDIEQLQWKEILPKLPLEPGSQNLYEVNDENIYTHLRLNIFPDGGVARLKVYGEVVKGWSAVTSEDETDLAAAENGARAVLCNDMFFSHMDNLIMPGRGVNMGDGWETKRNRTAGNKDWVIVQLAHKGSINKILIDTAHFKGNYPDRCMIEGTSIPVGKTINFTKDEIDWATILPQVKLQADHEHYFEDEIISSQLFTHVRLTIFPDGGISRMRLFGKIS